MFKTASLIKKSIITIISKTRIIIITFIKLITSIIFVKIKVDDIKKLICYKCNQIDHIKRDCFQLNKKTARVHIMKVNNNDNL